MTWEAPFQDYGENFGGVVLHDLILLFMTKIKYPLNIFQVPSYPTLFPFWTRLTKMPFPNTNKWVSVTRHNLCSLILYDHVTTIACLTILYNSILYWWWGDNLHNIHDHEYTEADKLIQYNSLLNCQWMNKLKCSSYYYDEPVWNFNF